LGCFVCFVLCSALISFFVVAGDRVTEEEGARKEVMSVV
jgi:hypothetical protein